MADASPQHQNGARWRALRARVLASEDTCGLCGGLVDKNLPHLDPGAPQVDHIVPISKGGAPFDRGNVRLSHRWCNRQRSASLKAAENRVTRAW